ncbi:transcriptional regulator [Halococcus sp. IIIV-5B]|uniref:transcriptional regulator n=1 Tax=Halococcus sp. IIIV-5B TaxID=2321230 RepID=UPI000E740A83|nr:transcriptional regulator [Halococcus sp. IIIV-5B]RJT08076.1 transcriptional regulator [Halococcus sp. IIIV-5B]
MENANATTRERIADYLRGRTAAAGTIANEFDIPTNDALSHVEHIAQSLDGTDEQLLAAPPECRDCGFAGFDDRANRPSRCPECRSESIEEPLFRVE